MYTYTYVFAISVLSAICLIMYLFICRSYLCQSFCTQELHHP